MKRKARKTAPRAEPKRRLTRLDAIVFESIQSHTHLSTADVIRRRDVLTAEVAAADAELTDLMARTADVRARRAKAEATIAGITHVLGGR